MKPGKQIYEKLDYGMILAILYGTRGDVLPCLQVLLNLLQHNDTLEIIIITHREQCCLLEETLLHAYANRLVVLYNKESAIIWNQSLYVDAFEEVPLNKYAWINNMNHLFIKNGFAIHMYYNWKYNHMSYEEDFCNKFFNN